MIGSGAEAADRKQRIRDRYKGVDTSELEVIRQKLWRGLEKAPLSVVLPHMSVFPLIMMNRLLRMNFRKIITRIISRHSRDGNSLESMMMKASAVHRWSIAKECSS